MSSLARIIIFIIILLLILGVIFTRCGGLHGFGGSGGSGGSSSGAHVEACKDSRLAMFAPGIQSTVWDDGSVAVAIPIEDQGQNPARNVQVTKFNIQSGTRIAPAQLPLTLGLILPKGVDVMDAHYKFPAVGTTYSVNVGGSYHVRGQVCSFDILSTVSPHLRDHNPITSKAGKTQKVNPSTALYPSPVPSTSPEPEFNANGARAPQGQPRRLFPATPKGTSLELVTPSSLGKAQPQPPGSTASAVEIAKNIGGGPYGGFPPDPNAAGADPSQVVIYTANTGISYSVNDGPFTTVNLSNVHDPSNPKRTTFFPESDGGLCCDQVVQYIPKRNIFVWLQQYWEAPITLNGVATKGPNRLRIAWSTPAAIASDFLHAWTYVDLTSAQLGLGNDWMDYPDLAFSDNYLYVGVDHAIQGKDSVDVDRHVIVRLSLNDIVGPGPTVNFQYMDPAYNGLWQNHIVQNSNDAMYWTARPDTSTLTVFAWPDSSQSATPPHDIKISSYNNSDYSVPGPDGPDWNVAPHATLGAARTHQAQICTRSGCPPSDFLYFALSAGRDTANNRAYPYVRVEKVNTANFTLLSEVDIWNSAYAFATPALGSPASPGQDEVAISLVTGGGVHFANNAVGFLNDFVVYVTTDSDATQASYLRDKTGNIIYDDSGNPEFHTRYGDYFDARNSIGLRTPNGIGVGYSTLGYAIKAQPNQNCAEARCSTNLHYILWGRPGELNPAAPPK
jgi:hypothetical protein